MYKSKFKLKKNTLDKKIKWGLGIGDWGLGIGDWAQSPKPSRQNTNPHPQKPLYFFI